MQYGRAVAFMNSAAKVVEIVVEGTITEGKKRT